MERLLLAGEREEACSLALSSGHSALALLLSTVCDRSVFQSTAAASIAPLLPRGSPLHSLCLLFTGQLAQSPSLSSAAGQWRPTLRAILRNRTPGWDTALLSLAGALARAGEPCAADVVRLCALPGTQGSQGPRGTPLLPGVDPLLPRHAGLATGPALRGLRALLLLEHARKRAGEERFPPAAGPKLALCLLLAECGRERSALAFLAELKAELKAAGLLRDRGDQGTRAQYPPGLPERARLLEQRLAGAAAGAAPGVGFFGRIGETLTRVISDSTAAEEESAAAPAAPAPAPAPRAPAPAPKPPLPKANGFKQMERMQAQLDGAAKGPPAGKGRLEHSISMPNMSAAAKKAPKAEGEKRPSFLGSWIMKKLYPEATVAHEGKQMEAYFDDKLGRWVFPDDPQDEGDPSPPPAPPTAPAPEPGPSPAPDQDDDPLAALMAPPSTTAVGHLSAKPNARYVDPFAAMGIGAAAADGPEPPAAPPAAPPGAQAAPKAAPKAAPANFAIFAAPKADGGPAVGSGPPPNFLAFQPAAPAPAEAEGAEKE